MHFRRSKTAQNSRLGSVQFSVHLGGNSCGPVLLLGDRSFFKDDLCFLRISVLVNWSHISIHWTFHSILPTYHFSLSYLKYWAFGPKHCIHTSIFVLYINVFLVHLISWFTIKKKLMHVLCGAIYWEILYSVVTLRKQYVYSYWFSSLVQWLVE